MCPPPPPRLVTLYLLVHAPAAEVSQNDSGDSGPYSTPVRALYVRGTHIFVLELAHSTSVT
jgi:hypothetical protein